MLEVSAVKATVAGQEALRLAKRVSADQKVGRYARTLPAALPVDLPGPPRLNRRLYREGTELHSQFVQHLLGLYIGREVSRNFCPDHVTGQHSPAGSARLEGLSGPEPEHGIASNKIENDAAIDGGDHVGILPRGARS